MKLKECHVFCILSIIIMIAIYSFSNQEGETSYRTSNIVINFIQKKHLDEYLPLINGSIEYTVRKIAHITIYFILGIFVSSSIIFWIKNRKNTFKRIYIFGISSLICFIYACFDEFHQTFIDGRTGKFRDVGYDALGFMTAIILTTLIFKISSKRVNSENV